MVHGSRLRLPSVTIQAAGPSWRLKDICPLNGWSLEGSSCPSRVLLPGDASLLLISRRAAAASLGSAHLQLRAPPPRWTASPGPGARPGECDLQLCPRVPAAPVAADVHLTTWRHPKESLGDTNCDGAQQTHRVSSYSYDQTFSSDTSAALTARQMLMGA